MSRNHFNELSPCEALIMKLIWEAPQDIPVQDLIDQLRDDYKKEYARTTVVTFVGKLKDKRFVDTYRKGKAAFIHPLRTEDEYRAQLLKKKQISGLMEMYLIWLLQFFSHRNLQKKKLRKSRRLLTILISNIVILKLPDMNCLICQVIFLCFKFLNIIYEAFQRK